MKQNISAEKKKIKIAKKTINLRDRLLEKQRGFERISEKVLRRYQTESVFLEEIFRQCSLEENLLKRGNIGKGN